MKKKYHLIINHCVISRILNIMKITTVLLFTCIFSILANNSYSQTTLLSLKHQNTTILDVLGSVEKNSEYVFIFSNEILTELNKKVTIQAKSETISDILDNLLQTTGLTYRINDRQVTILKNNAPREQETLKVSGRVVDDNGDVLIGVTIQEVGTNNIVVTDINGHYDMYNIASPFSVLRFSYVGFVPQDIKVGNQKTITVKMITDAKGLEEVVVVGYGSQKRESVIGAIATVKPTTLQINQTRSLSNALAGQIAGVIAVQRSGEPGYDNSDFWIRGISTFGANSKPLILVDGIERELNNISSEEIASFSVLKDATATAVYGVRGANGVILIETKKGKIGKPTITVKADYGISNPTQLPDFVDGVKYMEVMNDALILSGQAPKYSEAAMRKTRTGEDPDLYPNVNWLKLVTKDNVPSARASVDINGGSERLRYSLVIAYMGEKGIIATDPNTNYDPQLRMSKYNVRSNVDINLTSSTLVNVSIGGYITNRVQPGTGISSILGHVMDTPPIVHPAVYSNGQFPQVAARYNPWLDATQTGYVKKYENSLQSIVSLTQDIGKLYAPLEGLSAKALFSFDAYNYNSANRTKTPTTYFATGRDEKGELITNMVTQGQEFLSFSQKSAGNRTMYFEGRLNYNRKFGDHGIDGLLLINLRDYYNGDTGDSEKALPYRNAGIAGRTAYNFKDTYFGEFNFGYNGSENFKRGYRFGFFPSVAIGWLLTNESFMQPVTPVLSKLKIRGSWGLVGNDRISSDDSRRFAYLSTISSASGYKFGYNGDLSYGGYKEGAFGIPYLTWETAEKIDIGAEIGLWNWLNLQVDIFKEKRRDIFMERKTIPEVAGYNQMPYANFGRVENKGIDINLELNHQFSKDLFASLRGNFTWARNKITEYDESESVKKTTRARTGQSLNQHFGLIAEGLYADEDFTDPENGILKEGIPIPQFGVVKPGDIKYKDINGDHEIDVYDESPIGKPYVPEIVYGFGFNIKYKNVDLGTFFQGAGNFTNMLQGSTFMPGSGGGAIGNIYSNADDRWTPENQSSEVFWPRLSITKSEHNMRNSTWWIRNASYLRLKNLEIGYTLPKSWQKVCAMRNARVFFRGSNLLTWAPFDMWDPELGSQDGLKYPLQKIYSFGLEVTF